MIQYIALAFVYFFEFMIEYIFFARIAKTKKNLPIRLLIGLLLFENAGVLNYIFSNSLIINSAYYLTICLVFSFLCFVIPLKQRIFYSILLYGFSTVSEFGVIFVITSILKVDVNAYNSDPVLLIIIGCISKAIYFVICLVLLQFIESNHHKSKLPLSFYIYPLVTTGTLVILWVLTLKYEFTYEIRLLLSVISLILLGATISIFLSYQQSLKKENEYILLKSEYHRLQTEKTYYDILEHQNQQLLIYAHDAKNHLKAIKDLNTSPDIDRYIKQMYDCLSDYSSVSHSGNMTLDVIINRYITESKLKDITFSFDIRLSNLSFVEDFDLVTILDNLLDNAMDSAEQSGAKTISFETDRRNSYEIVIISNSCEQNPVADGNRLITTKKEKAIHGLGLKSVTKALKKYDGDIDWEYSESEKLFITTVMMRNPNPNNLP